MLYDLAIIGGGPAGVGAGVYAARKKIKTVFITESFVSQSTVSDNIQNWIGTKSISGYDLAKSLEGHLRAQAHGDQDIAFPHEQRSDLRVGQSQRFARDQVIESGKMLFPGQERPDLGQAGVALKLGVDAVTHRSERIPA